MRPPTNARTNNKRRFVRNTVIASVQAAAGNPAPLLKLLRPVIVIGLAVTLGLSAAIGAAFGVGMSLAHAGSAASANSQSGAANCQTKTVRTGALPTSLPVVYRQIFVKAAASKGADVNLLATIFWVENGQRYPDPPSPYGLGLGWPVSGPGAMGPFQFMPGTWTGYGVDGNSDGVADPNDLTDAAYSSAAYLVSLGGKAGTPLGDPANPHAASTLVKVMASYNAGPAGNFGNPETQRYIQLGAAHYLDLTSDPLANPGATSVVQICTNQAPSAAPALSVSLPTGKCVAGIDKGTAATFNANTITLCEVRGILVNASIAKQIDSMVAAAAKDGITLAGSGFRSYREQVRLRIQHHCGDVYTASSNTCSPPTAVPGTSMHEQGLAVDYKLSAGVFNWLQQHAGIYGFKNLPSETWHWSVNGG